MAEPGRLQRDDDLQDHVAAHIGDADVFEAAQVGHVDLVCQVVPDEVKRQAGLAADHQVRSRRCAQQYIGGRRRYEFLGVCVNNCTLAGQKNL